MRNCGWIRLTWLMCIRAEVFSAYTYREDKKYQIQLRRKRCCNARLRAAMLDFVRGLLTLAGTLTGLRFTLILIYTVHIGLCFFGIPRKSTSPWVYYKWKWPMDRFLICLHCLTDPLTGINSNETFDVTNCGIAIWLYKSKSICIENESK